MCVGGGGEGQKRASTDEGTGSQSPHSVGSPGVGVPAGLVTPLQEIVVANWSKQVATTTVMEGWGRGGEGTGMEGRVGGEEGRGQAWRGGEGTGIEGRVGVGMEGRVGVGRIGLGRVEEGGVNEGVWDEARCV